MVFAFFKTKHINLLAFTFCMFQFLKQFFQKKEQPVEEVTVPFDKLEQWLSEQANQAAPRQQSTNVLEKEHQQLLDEKTIILNNLNVFLQQSLPEKKTVEEKQQLAKFRSDYTAAVTALLTTIPEHLPDPETWQDFYARYQQAYQVYTSSQQISSFEHEFSKNYRLLQHSLTKVQNIVQQLHNLLNTENVHLINTSRDLIRQLKEMLLTRQYIDVKLQEVSQLKEEERKQREGYTIKIEKLKKNTAFQQYAVLVEQRDALSRELEELQMKLEHLFVSMARVLKQFSQRTPDEQLVKNYLLHPTSALLEDTPLSIARVLERVKEQLEPLVKNGVINEEQQKKYTLILSFLSRDKLQQMQTRLAELQRKKTEHERSIRGNILMQEYNDLKYKYDHYDYKMRKHDVLLAELQKKYTALSVQDTLTKLQELLLQCTQKKVTIVFSEQATLLF